MKKESVYLPCELFLAMILLLVAFILNYKGDRILNLVCFILAGLFHGLYYGKNNHRIFHFPYKDEYYWKIDGKKEEEIQRKLENPNYVLRLNNESANSNVLWVHLICSFAASIALYFLSIRINILEPSKFIRHAGLVDLILFAIVLIGFCGLLPMTVWFFANTGKLLEKLIKS